MASLELKEYFVREDTNNARQTLIHYKTCNYVKKISQVETASSIWHGPYTKSQAEKIAKEISNKYVTGWGISLCCMSSK